MILTTSTIAHASMNELQGVSSALRNKQIKDIVKNADIESVVIGKRTDVGHARRVAVTLTYMPQAIEKDTGPGICILKFDYLYDNSGKSDVLVKIGDDAVSNLQQPLCWQ